MASSSRMFNSIAVLMVAATLLMSCAAGAHGLCLENSSNEDIQILFPGLRGQLRVVIIASGERYTIPAGTPFPLASLRVVSCGVTYVVSPADLRRFITSGAELFVGTGTCGRNNAGLQVCVYVNGQKITSICLSATG